MGALLRPSGPGEESLLSTLQSTAGKDTGEGAWESSSVEAQISQDCGESL